MPRPRQVPLYLSPQAPDRATERCRRREVYAPAVSSACGSSTRPGAHSHHAVATVPVRPPAWIASPVGTPVEEPPSIGARTTHTVRPPRRTP
ncbi:hypothetical protein C0Q60_17885 [Streptomyces albidoflavus]|nr:hypothetical protein C0Q60_17885 [Streptomyces albidoflavus]RZD96462.1 hypothetical protein C0Q62_17760 [Streptomyces albidoflavus]